MTTTKQKITYGLTGRELAAYRQGCLNGEISDYFPGGYASTKSAQAAYDRGYRDGERYGDRNGKPWSFNEVLKTVR